MKALFTSLAALLILAVLTSSCGFNSALQVNQNAIMTNVTLGQGNFKIVERISGNASQDYVLFIGGMNKT